MSENENINPAEVEVEVEVEATVVTSGDLASAVESLKAAKDESGVALAAEQSIAAVRAGLRSVWGTKLEIVALLKVIEVESLFHFAKMANGKPYPGFKPLVKAIFKAETAGWTDKGLRNSWAVTLVDLGLTHEEAGEALNVARATVTRACADADVEAGGGDPDAERKAKRAAQESKSAATKQIESVRASIVTMADSAEWTPANLVDYQAALWDAGIAVAAAMSARPYKGLGGSQGGQGAESPIPPRQSRSDKAAEAAQRKAAAIAAAEAQRKANGPFDPAQIAV